MDVIVEGLEEYNIEIKTRATFTLKGTPEAWDEVYHDAVNICTILNTYYYILVHYLLFHTYIISLFDFHDC